MINQISSLSSSSLRLIPTLYCAILALASPLSAQTTYNFDGGAGAANSSWANATNWAGDALPTFNTNAVLAFDYNFGSSTNILFTSNSYTARSLVFGSNLTGGGFTSLQIRTKSQIGGGSAGLGRILTLNGGATNASIVIENISDSSLTRLDLGSGAGASEGSVAFATSVDLTHNSSSALFLFNNLVTGTGALNKYGIGTAAFNRANTFSGGINIYDGTILLYSDAAAAGTNTVTLGAGNSSGNAVLALGSFGSTAVTFANAVTVGAGSGTRTIVNSTNLSTGNAGLSNTLTLNKDVTFDITQYTANTNDRITVSGAVTGTGGIVKAGTGLLILSNAANSFGGLQINAGQVTLQTNATVSGLSGSGGSLALAGGTLTVNAAANSSYGQVISGAGSLAKSGAGTMTLGGNNTYGGATTVSAGGLIVNGNQSGATGVLDVASGATLGGSGTIGGATTISGILAPGNSIGTLTVANDVTWNSGNNWVFELGGAGPTIASPGTSDLLAITGGNDFFKGTGLAGSFTFDFAGTGDFGWYKLVDWAGGTTSFTAIDFAGVNLGGGYTSEFAIQDNALYVNVVPEPSTYALLALAAAGLGAHFVRRRRSAR
jgi:fibronectin-binding autotransporter adhesin